MLSRKLHKIVGLIMLIPMVGWTLTGVVFLTKPGYEGAYEKLELRTYPLEKSITLLNTANWKDIRLVKSILGDHLLVTSGDQALHISPNSSEKIPVPNKTQLKLLFDDTISQNPERYGFINHVDGTTAYTSTGVKIGLDWTTLRFTQTGNDRALISLLYKVHYLQWTPWVTINTVLGVLSLLFLTALTIAGLRVYIINRKPIVKRG